MPKRYSKSRRQWFRESKHALATLIAALSDDEPTREIEIALVVRMIEYVRSTDVGRPVERVGDFIQTIESPEFFALAKRMEAKYA